MKISVIMVDGGFRPNNYGAKYFSMQDFPENDFEIIWVEYYHDILDSVTQFPKVKTISLEKNGEYHSSFCFNRGIMVAKGEILVIPDADQIVENDFLSKVWRLHQSYEKLAIYGYRYDEPEQGCLSEHSIKECKEKCVLKNPNNFGGCLTVRRKWLLAINGYEQHPIFRSGFQANGLDISARFKNYGLAIQWEPDLRLYHPWHHLTLAPSKYYGPQHRVIDWRRKNMSYLPFCGIDESLDSPAPEILMKKRGFSRIRSLFRSTLNGITQRH